MRNKKVIINIIIYIILIGVIISLISRNGIIREKQVIKEMSESTQVSNLQNQINQLNSSQEEYAKNVQIYKAKIAEAITNQNVTTLENATADEIVTNIGEILQERTKDATATADNITAGKTAYINGELITGNGADNNSYYTTGITEGSNMTSMKRKLIASNVNNQGTYTSCSDGTKLSDLGTLDITNFACIPKNVSGSGMVSSTGWYTASSSINPSLSYNNGTLSISGLTITSYDGTRQWNTSTVTVDIYVYYCD